MTQRRIWRMGVCAILLLQILIGSPLLRWPGFAQDDFCWLEDARRTLAQPTHIGTLHISGFFRPLVHLSFAINYLIGGLNPATYFATNILLEMGCTFVLGLLARSLGLTVGPALAAMLLFSAHGAHAEALGWISGRTTSIWTLMGLLTLLCWAKWRNGNLLTASDSAMIGDPVTGASQKWYGAAMLFFAAALLSKEEAVALLPIVGSMDLIFWRATLRRRIWEWWPLAPMCAVYLVAQYQFQSRNQLVHMGQYAVNSEVFANWYYRIPRLFVTQRVLSLPTALGLSVAGLLIGLAGFWKSPRRIVWIALFGLILAAFALMPTSPFKSVPPGSLASRYSYFATAGAALASAALLQAAIERRRNRFWAIVVVVGLLNAQMLTQYRHQRTGLLLWEKESVRGADVWAGLKSSSDLDALSPSHLKSIHVINPPIGMAHYASAIWLVSGFPPDCIFELQAGQETGGLPAFRWNDNSHRLERVK